MVKDHSDREKGNPLPPHRLLLSINSKGSFICTIPTDRITHTTAFVTPVVEHWLEREIAQWVHPTKDRSDDPSHHERTLYLWATSRSFHCRGFSCWGVVKHSFIHSFHCREMREKDVFAMRWWLSWPVNKLQTSSPICPFHVVVNHCNIQEAALF